ncbi:MAG: hypothetical protein JXR95_07495 [Deltaproteobacteria bacterium]|nr:hypothetical protein [Deltaproteobacteria bacterium]
MNTAVWTFLVIVVLFSVGGYFGLKKFSIYYANKKTNRIIDEFRKSNNIEDPSKSLSEIDRELEDEENSSVSSPEKT